MNIKKTSKMCKIRHIGEIKPGEVFSHADSSVLFMAIAGPPKSGYWAVSLNEGRLSFPKPEVPYTHPVLQVEVEIVW
jgi:hypothetical protein